MDIRTKQKQILLISLLFIIPLNLYKISFNLGSGIQWALFNYQQTLYGNQIFTLLMNIGYVFSGLVTGRSAVSIVFWSFATLLLVAALTLMVLSLSNDLPRSTSWCGILVITAGTCYVISCFAQYGPTLNGAAGFCIPLGIPVIWIVGFLLYSASRKPAEGIDGECGSGEMLLQSEDV